MSGYFDNSATTFVCPAAKAAIINALENINGNASSLHSLGLQAETAVRQARRQLAKALGAQEEEIFFTSGGTESNNTAVFGSVGRLKRRGNTLVTTAVEHSSVLESVKAAAERENLQAVFISPKPDASLDLDAFSQQLNEKTIFVSAMLCNNETGAIHDIPALARLVRQKAPLAYFHCDAVGAFGKMPINVKRLDVDLLSVSAHKIGGPKGTGALYVKKGVRPLSLLVGGRQQQGFRPGTESVPLIAGFGAAVEQLEKLEKNLRYIQQLRNLFIQQLQSQTDFTLHLPVQGSP